MEVNAEEVNLQVHNLPAVIMLECQLPQKLIDDLNNYLDKYSNLLLSSSVTDIPA